MGFRFSRSIKLMPGVSINLSRSGASVSVGPRGAKVTVGPRGVTQTVGLPGTGLYYTTTSRRSSATRKAPVLPAEMPAPPPTTEERLTLGFFKRLVTPDDEESLVAGMRCMVRGDSLQAVEQFQKSLHLADGAFLAGVLALKRGEVGTAITCLEAARNQAGTLGKYFVKYGVNGSFEVPVTKQITAKGQVGVKLLLLLLVEAYQAGGRIQEAIDTLNQLHVLDPNDLVVRVSRAELLVGAVGTREACQQVVELAKGATADSEASAALLLYKAGALRKLGVPGAALETVSELLGKRTLWSRGLVRAMKYERGLIYESLGESRKARVDWESLYAEDPDYEDVARRLQL
jgi:tetratricopeptide (TPR) repeat protein